MPAKPGPSYQRSRGGTPTKRSAAPPTSPSSSSPSSSKRYGSQINVEDPTIWHGRLRALLLQTKKARKAWDEVVLVRGLPILKDLVDKRNELAQATRDAAFAQGVAKSHVIWRDGYAWRCHLKLVEMSESLTGMLAALDSHYRQINSLASDAEAMIAACSRERGSKFTFTEPLWCTWPLARFCDSIIALSASYGPALDLLKTLVVVVTTDAPDAFDTEASEAKGEEMQAAVSYWACQPLLPDSAEWEEYLKIEVAGWS